MDERIVVGIDGSETARRALRWGAEEAIRRGARLEVVHAWTYPPMSTEEKLFVSAASLEQAAQDTLDAELVRLEEDGCAVTVTGRVLEGPAAEVLLRAAEGASLLVVGARGIGPLRSLLLGSVSSSCVRRAGCPVVVVPAVADRHLVA
jgi:nucleotide-binding universal stress UspA family protein